MPTASGRLILPSMRTRQPGSAARSASAMPTASESPITSTSCGSVRTGGGGGGDALSPDEPPLPAGRSRPRDPPPLAARAAAGSASSTVVTPEPVDETPACALASIVTNRAERVVTSVIATDQRPSSPAVARASQRTGRQLALRKTGPPGRVPPRRVVRARRRPAGVGPARSRLPSSGRAIVTTAPAAAPGAVAVREASPPLLSPQPASVAHVQSTTTVAAKPRRATVTQLAARASPAAAKPRRAIVAQPAARACRPTPATGGTRTPLTAAAAARGRRAGGRSAASRRSRRRPSRGGRRRPDAR